MAEPTKESSPSGGGGPSRHIAHETTQWVVVCTEPDYCRVGKNIIPFNSYALIGNEQRSSPNVKAQGTPVYRVGDLHKGVLADAGSHIVAGTSLGSGYVKFLTGQNNVKVNGIPVVRQDNDCLINCNAAGVGGARGKVVTEVKPASGGAGEEDFQRDLEHYTEFRKYSAEEAGKLSEKIDQAKQRLRDTTPLWDWTERGQLKDKIAQLEAQRSYYDSSVEYYGREMARVTNVLYPDTPVMSAGPSGEIEASLRRIQEKKDLATRKLDASISGGPVGAAAVMAGANPDVARAFGELAMLGGRLGKTPVARGRGGATPKSGGGAGKAAGPGVFVKPKAEAKKTLAPGAPEHKADRWKRYQEKGGKKSYEDWSKQYDTNMRNYQYGLSREADYRSAMGASEGTLKTPFTNRQIDILKAEERYAGQLKTGRVSLTKENILAIQKDAELVKRGWTVEHILEQGASKPYLQALDNAGITYNIGSKIP